MKNDVVEIISREVSLFDLKTAMPEIEKHDISPDDLVEWALEYIDYTMDGSVIKKVFDEGYVTDGGEHQIADSEDIMIVLWTFLANDVCKRAVDSLTLFSGYDEIETRDRVYEFLCANEEELAILIDYKARRLLSEERIMYIERDKGEINYVNSVQTYVMKGV